MKEHEKGVSKKLSNALDEFIYGKKNFLKKLKLWSEMPTKHKMLDSVFLYRLFAFQQFHP